MLKKWGAEKSLAESVGGYLCNWNFLDSFAGNKLNPFVTRNQMMENAYNAYYADCSQERSEISSAA
ncbi:MAG: hypothetical protein LBG30_05480, partial [Odoribacteraceae bacterium]|nr:hypothetical protein [Odoribacteraceae bacterium]